MTELCIEIDGTPVPQGSKKGFVVNGRAVLVEASKNLKPWRAQVTAAAAAAMAAADWQSLDGPVTLIANFRLPRPASSKRDWPTTKPDLDKLLRALCDGLSDANVWADDSRVVLIITSKEYADGRPAGVTVKVVPNA